MSALRQRMQEDMQLRGLAPRTQASSLSAIQQLARHYGRSPATLTEFKGGQVHDVEVETQRADGAPFRYR